VATFVILPGHFLGGAAWARVQPLLESAGHRVLALDLTGWGEQRAHLASDIGLETHVREVVDMLEARDLQNVILVGHSYGGLVAAGVASRAGRRLAHVVLVDAPVPRHGDTLFGHLPDAAVEYYRDQARTVGDGWRVPPPSLAGFQLGEADRAWLTPLLGAVPLLTCEQALDAPNDALWGMPRTYIWCREYPVFAGTAAAMRAASGWDYRELASGHLPMVTHPSETAALLAGIANSLGVG
jgi:pimeloyl-ACP methyl ester carboxylesterase